MEESDIHIRCPVTEPASSHGYHADLAYIHDAGFGEVARQAAATLLKVLNERRQQGKRRSAAGLVVELGCGSGILSERLVAAGYRVLGFDMSPAMVELAQARVPDGEFRSESFVTAEIPPCTAVTAIGEVFCYQFDPRGGASRLQPVLRRIHRALEPGGVLLFDVAGPGRVPAGGTARSFVEGADWACLVTAEESAHHRTLTRTITAFRQQGETYRRSREIHRLRLYSPAAIRLLLADAGFRARVLKNYGTFRFPAGWCGFLATKPR